MVRGGGLDHEKYESGNGEWGSVANCQCCRNRPLRGFATHREANTPSEASAEFPIYGKNGFYHRDSEAQSARFVHLPALSLSAFVPLC